MRALTVLGVLFTTLLLVLTGCNGQNGASGLSEADFEQALENLQASSYEPQTVVVDYSEADGIPLETYVVEQNPLPALTNEERFAIWQREREAQDKYATYRKVADRDVMFQELEDEFEEYCEDNRFQGCLDLFKLCDRKGCYKTTVTCNDFERIYPSQREECVDFKVDIDEECDDDDDFCYEVDDPQCLDEQCMYIDFDFEDCDDFSCKDFAAKGNRQILDDIWYR